jgi:hypothetical protein
MESKEIEEKIAASEIKKYQSPDEYKCIYTYEYI